MAQAWIQLLSLLGLLLSAQAAPPGYGDTVPRYQWEERAGLQEFESNTTTIQEILRELPGDQQQLIFAQDKNCHTSVAHGGTHGKAFSEKYGCSDEVKITGMIIRSGSLVDSIQLKYSRSGSPYGSKYGGAGGGNNYISLHPDEVIIAVFGRSGSKVDSIGFATNQGRIFGPYGGTGGGRFTVNKCEVQGIFGRYDKHVESLGFYCME